MFDAANSDDTSVDKDLVNHVEENSYGMCQKTARRQPYLNGSYSASAILIALLKLISLV